MSGEDSFNFQLFFLHLELLFYLNLFHSNTRKQKIISSNTCFTIHYTLNSFIWWLNLFIFLSCFPRIYLHRNPDFFHSSENTKIEPKTKLINFSSNSRATIGFAFTRLIYFMVFIFRNQIDFDFDDVVVADFNYRSANEFALERKN